MGMVAPKYYVTETGKWDTWFAWYPVRTTDGARIFWKKCYRRYVRYTPRFAGNKDGYEYANIFTIIKK